MNRICSMRLVEPFVRIYERAEVLMVGEFPYQVVASVRLIRRNGHVIILPIGRYLQSLRIGRLLTEAEWYSNYETSDYINNFNITGIQDASEKRFHYASWSPVGKRGLHLQFRTLSKRRSNLQQPLESRKKRWWGIPFLFKFKADLNTDGT